MKIKAADEDILIAYNEGGEEAVMQVLKERYEEQAEKLAIFEAEDSEHGISIVRRCMEIKKKYTFENYLNEHEQDNIELLKELQS